MTEEMKTKRNQIRKDIETNLNTSISMIKILIKDISFEEFISVIENDAGISKYNLSANDIKEILFDVTSDVYFTKEEITELKSKVIQNKNDSFVPSHQLIKYFDESELSDDVLNIIFGRNIDSELLALLKEWKSTNPSYFDTLNPEMLDKDIYNILGSNFERIILYELSQEKILGVLKDQTKKSILVSLINGKDAREIEIICDKINNLAELNPNFLTILASSNIKSYLIMFFLQNPKKAEGINSLEELVNFEELESSRNKIKLEQASPSEIKDMIFQSLYHKSISEIEDWLQKYGEDIEELEKLNTNPELKKYISQMVQIKKIYNTDSPEMLKYYYEYNTNLPTNSIDLNVNMESALKQAYNSTIVNSLSKEPEKEVLEDKSELGYRIVKVSGEYQKMISVIDAFGSDNGIDITEKLHGPLSKVNHARCYSMFSNENPGMYKAGYESNAVIIEIEGFNPQAIVAASNMDIGSSSSANVSDFIEEKERYAIGENYANRTRDGYSEFVIDNEYYGQTTEVSSLICLDEVNEASIKAARSLSQKYGKVIDIEIVDMKELFNNNYRTMLKEYKAFIETRNPHHLINYIRICLNITSAYKNNPQYYEYFDFGEIMDSSTIFNSINEALKLVKNNEEAIKLINEYIAKERSYSSLISSICPENVELESTLSETQGPKL